MPPRRPRLPVAAWLAGALLALSACTTNPATGERQFTALMSPEQEKSVGAEQHKQVMDEFGGPYDNPAIQAYVDKIGQRLAANTERPDVRYTFTVLDSDIVNAFALPGGYVYVTRGLMALANNEAQLAGVIGHEIGHVTARHSAERYSRGTLAQVGAVLATVLGGAEVGQLAQQGAAGVLAGWSRGQELEADSLGIRYMAGSGFAPTEMSSFLATMGRHAQLQALLAGKPGAADQFSYLQTHPPTGERVEQAAAAAKQRAPQDWETDGAAYLRTIDGMLYGDSPKNGYVRGQVFAHPSLGFRFEVPEGFRLLNGQSNVTAIAPDGKTLMVFDGAPGQGARNPAEFIAGVWAPNAPLSGTQTLTIDGLPAATAITPVNTRSGQVNARLVAIRWDADSYYRFLFVTPTLSPAADRAFQDTATSFRRLTSADRAGLRPYRLRVVQVRAGETVEDLARRMPFRDYPEERFRVLNDIAPGTPLRPGQLVKLVVAD